MKKALSLIAIVALAFVVVALVGCSSSTPAATTPTSSSGGGSSSAPAAGGAPAVSIANFAFAPVDLTVKVGDTVTWTNNDSVAHTVTSDTGAFQSPSMPQGATFTFTFSKAGSYPYHCSVHPSMTAKITVQ